MKKRLVAFGLLTLLLLSMASVSLAAVVEPEEIAPMYNYTSSITASLTFSGGTAKCSGTLKPSGSYGSTIRLTLYRKDGNAWYYVASWSGSASGASTAVASGSASVGSGTFRLVAVGNVGNGLERPSTAVVRTN